MRRITFSNPWVFTGLTAAVLASGVLGACGPVNLVSRGTSLPTVRQATVSDPADPNPAAYLPLVLGQTWRYTNVGTEGRGDLRSETIVQLLERPARDGSGTMTVAEIERLDSGKKRLRFTVEVNPNGMVRSYDPSLPKLGAPILGPKSDKPQDWGYNPGHGATGYFGIVQWPGTSNVTVGPQTFTDCLKITLSTSGSGFKAFRREITWAPDVGPVRIVEGDATRQSRIYELATVVKP